MSPALIVHESLHNFAAGIIDEYLVERVSDTDEVDGSTIRYRMLRPGADATAVATAAALVAINETLELIMSRLEVIAMRGEPIDV